MSEWMSIVDFSLWLITLKPEPTASVEIANDPKLVKNMVKLLAEADDLDATLVFGYEPLPGFTLADDIKKNGFECGLWPLLPFE